MTTDDMAAAPMPLAPRSPAAPKAAPKAPRPMGILGQRLTAPTPPTAPMRLPGPFQHTRLMPAAPGGGATPAGAPLTNRVGDGFNPQTPAPAGPSAAVPGGTILTSSAGDGFGAPMRTPDGAGSAPSFVDRFRLAQDRWNTYVANEATPQYQAALRQANRLGAAGGQLGAGELRTDFGNLTQAYNRDITNAGAGFLSNALEGTIGDRQQAFQNELASLGLSDDLTNSAFGRALQTYHAGNLNNPTKTGLEVGGYQAGNAARSGQSWMDLLRLLGSGSSAVSNQTPGDGSGTGTGNWQPNWDWRATLPSGG